MRRSNQREEAFLGEVFRYILALREPEGEAVDRLVISIKRELGGHNASFTITAGVLRGYVWLNV